MDSYYPFIHKIERKEDEPQALYIELYYPEQIQEEKEDVQEDSTVIIIDLL